MNYQFLRKALTNYLLDQNRASNYQKQLFSPFRQSKELKPTVNGSRDRHMPFYRYFFSSFPPINYYHLPLFPHELPPSSNMPPRKTAHDPLTIFFNPSN
jgi:hypothetical protein